MTDQTSAAAAAPLSSLRPSAPALAEYAENIAAATAAEAEKATAVIASEAKQSTTAAAATIAAEVEAWFVEQIHNSPVARAGAEIFNHVRAAVDALKSRLAKL